MPRLTPVVLNLIIINGLVFVALNLFQEEWFINLFLLYKTDLILDRPTFFGISLSDNFQPLQIVTSFFAHIDLLHIFFNMYALAMFGTALEMVIGSKRFLKEYLIFGVGSGIIITLLDPSPVPVLGASTAISGLMVSFAMLYPDTRLGMMFIPIQFKAIHFVIGLAVISGGLVAYQVITGNSTGQVSHFGHFAGMAVAFLYHKINQFSRNSRRR